jgi:hypothetical protein
MEARTAITVRMPHEMMQEAKELKEEQESRNQLIIDALSKELRRRCGLKALESIRRTREKIRRKYGVHPSSVPFIRALREGTERHG